MQATEKPLILIRHGPSYQTRQAKHSGVIIRFPQTACKKMNQSASNLEGQTHGRYVTRRATKLDISPHNPLKLRFKSIAYRTDFIYEVNKHRMGCMELHVS